MGDHGGRAQPGGLFPTGLLSNTAAGVGRSLDMERWSKAEERTAELIARIQPNRSSEERRNAVSSYVQRLIMKCFSCRVFTFGSVPLKTYLPDGDIDLTAFSENENLKDTWANEVRDALESEEKNENAEYHVKEVQYIQAEVKIIKCLVEDIVVDISFNQVGGLCTLCFLDEIDSLINQNHLFKQSVILTKAWCYYESRILGAHHGLISTYALETLVLYIFHVYNNSFAGPLEVLYRFLEFFSNFDWGNFCVSLWGPIPISSLPNMIAEPPREDGGDLLLSKLFLDVCSAVYAVLPAGQENQGQPFVSKYFNIVDPLRINNNLGRSVSKGNFFRIRSAFAFGAKSLARLLECPKEDLIAEVNQFFTNTWERHGNGTNPDAPIPNRWPLQTSKTAPVEEFNNIKKSENNALLVCHEYQIDGGLAFHGRPTSKVLKKTNISSRGSAQIEIQNNKKYLRPDQFQEGQDSFQFARTHSSPDLTDISTEALVRGSRNKVHESGKHHIAPSRLDHGGRIKNSGFDEPSPSRHHRPSPTLEAADSHSTCNSYHGSEEQIALVSETTLDMHQEEQDLVNMMASSRVHNVGEQVQLPIHLPSHVPFPVSSSLISYNHRIPMIDPSWGPMQYPQDRIFHEDEAGSNRSNPDNKKQTTLGQFYSVSSSRGSNSEAYVRGYDKLAREHKVPVAEDDDGAFQFQTTARNGNMVPFPVSKAVSSRSKPAFECALDGSDKAPKPARDKRGRRDAASMILSALGKSRTRRQLEGSSDQDSSQADDEASPQGRSHESPGREPAEVSELAEIKCSDSVVPVAPMQRVIQNPGVLPFTFYPTGPLVPFLAMLPVYNFPDGSSGQLDSNERLDHGPTNPSGQNESLSSSDACAELSEEHKSDILNSDFSSHWENLQYGRSCQSTRHVGPFIYPSPVVVPPVYLQGHFPWDGPGRPHSPNLNTFSQVMSYGPPQVPVAPLQQGLGTTVLPEGARYRGGTGTYLPNPKVPSRDRVPSSSSRNQRVNYNTDHNDHDREGSWINPKSRANPSRSHGRTRAEKPVSRTDRSSPFDNRRPWTSHRHESPDLYQPAHNSSFMSTNSSHNSVNMTYGVYPLSSANSNGMNLNRPSSYGSHNEPPDLGSLGVVNEVARPRDENPPREEYRVRHGAHQGSSQSSPG